ncbi:hypothetical protein D3C72_1044930 [compost metagenome]
MRIVRNDTEVDHLAAQLFQHKMHGQTVGVVDLARLQRLARQLQFVARREKRDAHFAHHVDLRNAERGQHRQLCDCQFGSGREHRCALGDIFPGAADVLIRFNAGGKTHARVGLFGLFLHHHRVAPVRHWRTGHDANAGPLWPLTRERLTGEGFSGDR